MTISFRQRMMDDMTLRNYAESTRDRYVQTLIQLCAFHNTQFPQRLDQEGIRQYFLHLKEVKMCANNTFGIHLAGIRFFYEKTLGKKWGVFDLTRPGKSLEYPVVLSLRETRELLSSVRDARYRTALTLIYSCGLRISEGLSLRIQDVDGDRMLIHVRLGKGKKDRYVPLPSRTLDLLREYWLLERPDPWFFPSSKKPGPIAGATLHRAFKAALGETRIIKNAHVHTLRHSYATHLLEAGVPVSVIQWILGHKSLKSTLIYMHMTSPSEFALQPTLDQLMADL